MKSVGLAAVICVTFSFIGSSSFAASLIPGGIDGAMSVSERQFVDLTAAASKKSKQSTDGSSRKRHHDRFNFSYKELGIIPGHVPTPYGYRDCIGRWHLHGNGVIHCHGQLIRDD